MNVRPGGTGVVVDGLRLAVGTLTALPVPTPSRVDRARARTAMLLAPAVALLPAAATALTADLALRSGLRPLLSAALAIGVLALVTRGLHLDGLADTADALAASYDRARALDVMHRGNTGPAGAAALALVLIVQVAALADLLPTRGTVAAAVGVVAGRTTLPLVCARGIPAARPQGLGAAVAGTVPRSAAALVGLLTAAAGAAVTGRWCGHAVLGCLCVVASALVAALITARAAARFGGVTGDVLGACVEAGTGTALVVLAVGP